MFWQVIILVAKFSIACICSVNMVKIVLCRQRSSSDKRWDQKAGAEG